MALRSRLSLDKRLRDLGSASRYAPPRAGWVRAIRDALGMPAADLGQRMNMSAPAVLALERRESRGSVQLDTLARAAEAMDCTLVYAFIPNHGLEETVRIQAEKLARAELDYVQTTMALEDQAVSANAHARLVDERAAEIMATKGIWRKA